MSSEQVYCPARGEKKHFAAQHIARAEKRMIGDYNCLTAREVRVLIQECVANEGYDSALLLCMLFTGRSLERLVKDDAFRQTNVDSKFMGCGLFEVIRQYPLSSTSLPDEGDYD